MPNSARYHLMNDLRDFLGERLGRVQIGRELLGNVNQFPFTTLERVKEDRELLGAGVIYKHLHLRIEGYVKVRGKEEDILAAGDSYLEEIIHAVDQFHTQYTNTMNMNYTLHSISWTFRGTTEDVLDPYCIAITDLVAVYEEAAND